MEIENLIDIELLRKLQDMFSRGCGIYLFCLDSEYNLLTEFSGTERENEWVSDQISKGHYLSLIDKSRKNRVEHIVEETMEVPWLRLCSVGISISGKDQITWIVEALLKDQEGAENIPENMLVTDEDHLYRAIEFLSQMSRIFFAAKMEEVIAQEAMVASRDSQKKMESQLHRSEAMTDIVRMLESENGFSKIVDDIIKEACVCLNLKSGVLLQEETAETVGVICEYNREGNENWIRLEQYSDKSHLPFFDGKTYTISADSLLTREFEDFFREKEIYEGIFMPIINNDEAVMYLCFCDDDPKRNWSLTEIKFLSDVKHIVQGIFSKRVARNSLASSYVAVEAILENTGCGIYVMDPKSKTLLYTNEKFGELFSNTIKSGQLDQFVARQKDIPNSFEEIYVSEEDRWVDMNRTRIKWVDGKDVSLCTVYDVTDKKNYQRKIENQANNDFLTGLYNRMRCEQDLEKYIAETARQGKEGALLYIDLDDFKTLNDALGHEYGDLLLKEISENMKQIRGIENNCYRMGGDEFIVIITSAVFDRLGKIIQDIQEVFANPWILNEDDYYCTMCMGIVVFPTDADTVGDVIRKADLALYAAKRRGKSKVEFYNDSDAGSPYRRLDLETNIRKATLNAISEFEVYYQPIVNIAGEEDVCCGAEALARWNSAELGFISPGDFIPIAEYLGLINPIGDYIMERAARRCKHWNDMGHPEYHVNVNLSVIQLLQKDIVQKVEQVLKETRVNPQNIRLEVTESLAINDMSRMVQILTEIKGLGVQVALDDFGTGYSSLNHIRALPIDVIKIDRCFIEHIAEDDFSKAFVNMVVQLADAIGVEVCVEGVENDSQYSAVKEARADMIQGFYFGRPMEIEEFEKKYL